MKRIVILDPGLITVVSHNYSEANALQREARALQLSTRILCHRDAHRAVLAIPAEPFFRLHSYGHLADLRPATDFMAINFSNQTILKDLTLLTETVTSNDFVFFPTVNCNIVLAISQWMKHLAPADAPSFGLCLMFPPDTNTAFQPSAVAADTYRKALAEIPRSLADRIVYTCKIDALSKAYADLLGTQPVTLPIPTWASDAQEPRPPAPNEMRISFLGGARQEKGFGLLPDVISIVRKRYPAARFTVQAVGFSKALIASVVERLAAHRDVVKLIDQSLSDQALRAAMAATSLLLMPYDAEKYRQRGSSLFTEARRMGIPMVLPAGTAIGEEGLRDGIAATFEAFNADSVADAVMRAIDQRERLSEAARQRAGSERVRSQHYLAILLRRLGTLG